MQKEEIILMVGKEIIENKKIKRFLCGTYSDGKTRSFMDALRGEYRSPKMMEKQQKKNKKKKTGKKKHAK